jgi:enamine deaminase RidA (YjgF/YER057c/UK114 family)
MSIEVLGTQGKGRTEGRFLTSGVKANGFVFTGLHHGFEPTTYDRATESGSMPDDIARQTTFALHEVHKVLDDAGSTLAKVLDVHVYVDSTDDGDLSRVDEAYESYFRDHGVDRPPPRSIVNVVALCEAKIAVDLVALA